MSQRLFYPLSAAGWVLGALLLIQCAPKKSSTSDLSSRSPISIDDSQFKMAECNRISAPQISLQGQISTYYHHGQLIPQYLNVNLTQVPAGVLSGTQTLQIFRWSERIPGQKQTYESPVNFYFLQKGTGSVSNPSAANAISKAVLESLISQQRLGNLGITINNFFERHTLVLTGMDLNWDAALFSLYSGSQSAGAGSVLLPAFYSNPNIYAQANLSAELQGLHPNANYKFSGMSEAQYYAMTEQICAGFFGTVRAPASDKIENPLPLPKSESAIYSFVLNLKASVTRFLHNLFGL